MSQTKTNQEEFDAHRSTVYTQEEMDVIKNQIIRLSQSWKPQVEEEMAASRTQEPMKLSQEMRPVSAAS